MSWWMQLIACCVATIAYSALVRLPRKAIAITALIASAGYGIYLAAKELETQDYNEFLERFQSAKVYLDSSRPTAVNLSWALRRMEQVVLAKNTCR